MILRRGADFDMVCCSGGDGTLNEAIGAMMHLPAKPVFGYIPSGTTNDFATSLQIPKSVPEAVNAALSGNGYPIDVGVFGDDYFAYVAAFGLFTAITYDTPQASKNFLGHAAYMLEGVKRLRSIDAYDCKINIDGEIFSGNFVFGMASNSTSVGGFKMPSGQMVSLDDGLFEVILVKKPRSFADLQNIISALMGGEINTGSLILRKASKIRVVSKSAIAWTLDGEFGGSTIDVTVENRRQALTIMVPRPEIIAVE